MRGSNASRRRWSSSGRRFHWSLNERIGIFSRISEHFCRAVMPWIGWWCGVQAGRCLKIFEMDAIRISDANTKSAGQMNHFCISKIFEGLSMIKIYSLNRIATFDLHSSSPFLGTPTFTISILCPRDNFLQAATIFLLSFEAPDIVIEWQESLQGSGTK
jgi:hypothetical protein